MGRFELFSAETKKINKYISSAFNEQCEEKSYDIPLGMFPGVVSDYLLYLYPYCRTEVMVGSSLAPLHLKLDIQIQIQSMRKGPSVNRHCLPVKASGSMSNANRVKS